MSLFKRAAVRGVAHELVNKGLCEFPSKEAMDAAADAVADGPAMGAAPEVSGPQGHSPEELAQAAQKLMEIAHALMQEAQGGAGAPPMAPPGQPPPPEAPPEAVEAKAGANEVKQASFRDIGELAGEAAVALMEKSAMEKKSNDPKLVGGGADHSNKLTDAAKTDSVAALDEKFRPAGKYQVAMGDTGLDTAKGEIGHTGKTTVEPTLSPSGTNSINGASKKAALRGILEKHANKLVGLHDAKKNTLANSPDPLAKLDAKHRPEGYAHVGQGNANFSEDQSARVGLEKKTDVKPNLSPGGTNSITEASKVSEEQERVYLAAFEKCASDVGAYLPVALTEEEKVAAIDSMIEMDHGARQAKLTELHKVAEAPKADDTKKESALLARVREIATKASQPKA